MIYIDRHTEEQLVYIPKKRECQGTMSLKAVNTISKSGFVEYLEDYGLRKGYHVFSLTLPDSVASGEYEYELLDYNGILSQGILVIREQNTMVEYDNMTEYEQYERS